MYIVHGTWYHFNEVLIVKKNHLNPSILQFQVCQNLQNKKREVFDMHGKRIEGTIAADYKDKTPEVVEKGKNSSEWRKQHEKMISAIREAKKNGPPINASEPTIEIKV